MAKMPSEAPPESGTVSVACKMPHGLVLELVEFTEISEPVMGGGFRTVRQAVRTGKRVIVNGYRSLLFGQVPATLIAGGYALTPNVPAEFFSRWLEQNKDHPAVANGLIFGMGRMDNAAAKASEQAEIRSGLEPIDPSDPPSEFRSIQPAPRPGTETSFR